MFRSTPVLQLSNQAYSLATRLRRVTTRSQHFKPTSVCQRHASPVSRHCRLPYVLAQTMTTDAAVASPPTSPPAKRVKTGDMADKSSSNGTTVAITKVDQSPPLLIKKLSDKARLPTRGSAFAAGYDMYASKDTVIPARGKALVDTDISMAVPAGTYGRIAPRSGLASKHFIDTGAGVIDADYRGQVRVLLFNHADADFEVKEGDRVAQLVLERIYTPEVLEVQELEESVRGAGGFGSTGTN